MLVQRGEEVLKQTKQLSIKQENRVSSFFTSPNTQVSIYKCTKITYRADCHSISSLTKTWVSFLFVLGWEVNKYILFYRKTINGKEKVCSLVHLFVCLTRWLCPTFERYFQLKVEFSVFDCFNRLKDRTKMIDLAIGANGLKIRGGKVGGFLMVLFLF